LCHDRQKVRHTWLAPGLLPAKVPGHCPDTTPGNTTSLYCRAVRQNSRISVHIDGINLWITQNGVLG
ncbi:MAG TPA: hypothetical protein VJ954_08785, partial [Ignavibacteriaceae bacterium]|nr:hypothetical protein [Ignavibacteriaceae bacterium]